MLTASINKLRTYQSITKKEEANYKPLTTKSRGKDVLAFKNRMYELGYFNTKSLVDTYSENMASYIKKVQKVNGLKQDGVCSARFLAFLFSNGVLNAKGKPLVALPSESLEITKATHKKYEDGCAVLVTLKNKDKKYGVDAFTMRYLPYSAYGERYDLGAEVTLEDYINGFTSTREDVTIKKSSTLNGDKNGIAFPVYFAGMRVAIVSYHTTNGVTHSISDDQLIWYGMGKGTKTGVIAPKPSPLTSQEKKLGNWDIGATGYYVDDEFAKMFSLREGNLIKVIDKNSDAERAGLLAGDIILSIGEQRILGATTITRAKAAIKVGKDAQVIFWRNGDLFVTTLTRTK